MTGEPPIEAVVSGAMAHIADHGLDPATVLAMALESLAEFWADDARPLCRECGKRRCSRGDLCPWCAEAHDRQLYHKRATWERHGDEYRARQQAKGDGTGG